MSREDEGRRLGPGRAGSAVPLIELSNSLGALWEDGMEIDFQGPQNASESAAMRSIQNIATAVDSFTEANLSHSSPGAAEYLSNFSAAILLFLNEALKGK